MLMEKTGLHQLDAKMAYLDEFLPNIGRYSITSRIKIVHAMHPLHCRRNKVILTKGVPSDAIFFIHEGECSITSKVSGVKERCVVKMSKGTCFGEECGLLGELADHNVKVTSEYAMLYFLKKSDVMYVIPDDIFKSLVYNFQLKQKSRLFLKESLLSEQADFQLNSSEKYPMASALSRKKIQMQRKRNLSVIKSGPEDPLFDIYRHKLHKLRSGAILNQEEGPKLSKVRSFRTSLLTKLSMSQAPSRKGSPIISLRLKERGRRSMESSPLASDID